MTINESQEGILRVRSPEIAQSKLFAREDMFCRGPLGSFNYVEAQKVISRQRGKKILAIDIGGSRVVTEEFTVDAKGIIREITSTKQTLQHERGTGVLTFLKKVFAQSERKGLRIGLSVAEALEENRLVIRDWLAPLADDLNNYKGDFSLISPQTPLSVNNDAVSGLLAGSLETKSKNVIYIGVGKGFGAAVLVNDEIYALEPARVPMVEDFNLRPGKFKREERRIKLAAGGKAIEGIYKHFRGSDLKGEVIGELFRQGDFFPAKIYANSARVVASGIYGIARTFNLFNAGDLVVVCNGGVFEMTNRDKNGIKIGPSYGQWVKQVLNKTLNFSPKMMFTKDQMITNASLYGAAISAFILKSSHEFVAR